MTSQKPFVCGGGCSAHSFSLMIKIARLTSLFLSGLLCCSFTANYPWFNTCRIDLKKNKETKKNLLHPEGTAALA